jgi:hypothetical protein
MRLYQPRRAISRARGGVHDAPGECNLPVIPGPPQAEPGIQAAVRKVLDSGFALARAPE